jgi:alcohol dehydrogenase class IV
LPGWLGALAADLGVPVLSSFGIRREQLSELATKAVRANSMKANPVALGETELIAIVEAAL